MKQVKWTEQILRKFEQRALLSEEECYIMESRIKGATVTQQALKLSKSESTIHRIIKELKIKYDLVQQEYPDEFPKRKKSAKETYMDTH